MMVQNQPSHDAKSDGVNSEICDLNVDNLKRNQKYSCILIILISIKKL